jgi:hypothetical protein
MYGKWKTMIKGSEHREREEMSEIESMIKPPEADLGTGNVQSGSKQGKVITGMAEESRRDVGGGEDDEDETEEEELAKLIKKMLASGNTIKSIQKKMGEESKQEKSRQKTLGKGRGRGGGKAKSK